MKRFFLILFGLAAGLIAILAYRDQVAAALQFLVDRPFQALSAEQLQLEMGKADAQLAGLSDRMTGNESRPAGLDRHAARRDLSRSASGPMRRRNQLEAELSYRRNRFHYLLLGGFIFSVLVFFHYLRAIYLERLPGERGREQARAMMGRELSASLSAREEARQEQLGRLNPKLRQVKPGRTTEREALALLGPPAHTAETENAVSAVYLFDSPESVERAGTSADRSSVTIVFREGKVGEIRLEPGPSGPVKRSL